MEQRCKMDNYTALQKIMLDEQHLDSHCQVSRASIRAAICYSNGAGGLSH